MKNRFIESLKQRAKLYHRKKRRDNFEGGIVTRYSYTNMKADSLTFWDDAVFIVNDYRVALWWTHPRYEYQQLVEAEALRRIAQFDPASDPFLNLTGSNQASVGAPRKAKRQISWPSKEETQRYFALLVETERKVAHDVAFEVRPFMSIRWHHWCKGLTLCAPYEVRSELDLRALSQIARKLVKRETTIADELGDYQYGQQDWLSEYPQIENIGYNATLP